MDNLTAFNWDTKTPGLMIVLLSFLVIYGCSDNGGSNDNSLCRNGVNTPCIPKAEPHQHLADYNIYQGDLNKLNPVEELIPYNLNTTLFSDYAQKLRLMYVPDGKSIHYGEAGVFNFPVGSVIVKNFFYDLNRQDPSSDRRILETRLLMHYEDGWIAETYVWNDAQTGAVRQQTGAIKNVSWTDEKGQTRMVDYIIPTKNDCKNCHNSSSEITPLGPEARNLNKTYPYNDGEENQLVRWEQAGILSGRPALEQIPEVPAWDDPSTGTLNDRARIYLDVNCANCHNVTGSARNTGLFLNYQEKDSTRLGIYKIPIATGSGSGGRKYDIVPGKPDSSIVIFRMESVKPEVRMPEIGRTLVHDDAVALIREWIENLE